MTPQVCVVRTTELAQLLDAGRFIALPTEEVARYLGAVEVLSAEPAVAAQERSLTPLVTYVVAHYNYAWFTYRTHPSSRRSMGIVGSIEAGEHPPLFCDDSIDAHALRTLHESVVVSARLDLRMSGLLRAPEWGESWVALVYVARLRQPGLSSRVPAISEVEFRGIGELEQEREQFDPCSQLLIDKLFAL